MSKTDRLGQQAENQTIKSVPASLTPTGGNYTSWWKHFCKPNFWYVSIAQNCQLCLICKNPYCKKFNQILEVGYIHLHHGFP